MVRLAFNLNQAAMRSRSVLILSLIALVSFLAYRLEIALPGKPDINNTLTPLTQPAPLGIGSYDVLGHPVSPAEAAKLL